MVGYLGGSGSGSLIKLVEWTRFAFTGAKIKLEEPLPGSHMSVVWRLIFIRICGPICKVIHNKV